MVCTNNQPKTANALLALVDDSLHQKKGHPWGGPNTAEN